MVTASSLRTVLSGSDRVLKVLEGLHARALAEEAYVSTDGHPEVFALDKFVALDPDKCELVYLLLRSTQARHVIEAGTSFGLSTIYLALAVGQNAAGVEGGGKVIATENEPTKAAISREHWKQAGPEVEPWIELREGDLRETLKTDLPDRVDFLLLDSWPPITTLDCKSRMLTVCLLLSLDAPRSADTEARRAPFPERRHGSR